MIPHEDVTVERCISACDAAGYTSAGLEWSQECCTSLVPPPPDKIILIADPLPLSKFFFLKTKTKRGFESVRMFHERAPEIPLIAMSGYAFANADAASPDFLRMTLELGATHCLRKPFTPKALLAAVNDCLAKPSKSAQQS